MKKSIAAVLMAAVTMASASASTSYRAGLVVEVYMDGSPVKDATVGFGSVEHVTSTNGVTTFCVRNKTSAVNVTIPLDRCGGEIVYDNNNQEVTIGTYGIERHRVTASCDVEGVSAWKVVDTRTYLDGVPVRGAKITFNHKVLRTLSNGGDTFHVWKPTGNTIIASQIPCDLCPNGEIKFLNDQFRIVNINEDSPFRTWAEFHATCIPTCPPIVRL